MKRLMIVCTAVVLILAFTLGPGTAGAAQAGPPAEAERSDTQNNSGQSGGKDEVVYAKLSSGGSVDAIYAVNHFSSAQGKRITDYGDYESVVNLTDTNPLEVSGGAVSFTADADNYYYQGNMTSTDLPWIFDIAYTLDGAEISSQALAGKAGELEMRITSRQNTVVDPIFYENYMLQITVTLDTEKCGGISAPDGTIANASKDKVVTFTVLPESDADFSVTADITDFTMAGVDIASVPYAMSMDFPDTQARFADLEKLPEAISELNNGVGRLEDGAEEMKGGIDRLAGGSAGVKGGLDQLSGNSAQLVNASAQISGALAQIASSLNNSGTDKIDLSQMTQLPDGLNRLAGGLRDLSGGLTALNDAFGPAFAALDAAIQGIPQGTLTPQDIQGLALQLDDPADPGFAELAANYQAAQTVKATYAQVKAAFDAVGVASGTALGAIDTIAATLEGTAAEIGESLSHLSGLSQLTQLASGLNELSANYAAFHAGLAGYTDGVNTLASNYAAFHAGLAAFSGGVGEMEEGIGELYSGTNTLHDEIADMPDMIQTEIDDIKEQYMPADFDPVSFTSPQNTDTVFVQFVIQSDGIEKPEEEQTKTAEAPPNETFWDRLSALFG